MTLTILPEGASHRKGPRKSPLREPLMATIAIASKPTQCVVKRGDFIVAFINQNGPTHAQPGKWWVNPATQRPAVAQGSRHRQGCCQVVRPQNQRVAGDGRMTYRKRQKAAAARRTIGYVRVSTEDQAREGVSLDAQEARIAAYCTAMDFPVSEVIRDAGESAKSLRRPGIAKVVEWIQAGGIDRVVVAKLDRLTRSVRDLAQLIDLCAKHDVALVSIGETLDTSTAAGRMVVNMLGVVAQWEREAIGERTATSLAHKRQGRQVYGTPFGYRRAGQALVPHVTEQLVLREAVRMVRAGASFREIGAMLTERGAQPKRGKAWYASSVRAMLRSRIVLESVA